MFKIRCFSNQFAIFLLALFLLISNDLYFKHTFHNPLTGKLSDFTGLFIFSWFWALYFPCKSKLIYVGTALLFIFWKSPFSQYFFNEIGGMVGYTFTRTFDYTDLIALAVLPISYELFRHSRSHVSQLNKPIQYIISAICLFAFVATSAPKISVQPEFEFKPSYIINCSKNLLLTKKMTARYSQLTMAELLQLEAYSVETSGNPFSYNFDVKIMPLDSNKAIFAVLKMNRYQR